MSYSNSPLATYANTNHKHYTGYRTAIKGVILHHMAAKMTGAACANYFATTTRQVSANYCVGYDGDIALCVPEAYRAWTTGGYDPDGYYVTIECSDDNTDTWHVSDKSIAAVIALIADVFRRNGLTECRFDGTKSGSNLMAHKWYASTACPGEYLYSKFAYIAEEVNKLLKPEPVAQKPSEADGKTLYRVQVGAFGSKANAEKQVEALKKGGFNAIIKVDGDVDGDGDVDMNDVRELLRRVVGLNG